MTGSRLFFILSGIVRLDRKLVCVLLSLVHKCFLRNHEILNDVALIQHDYKALILDIIIKAFKQNHECIMITMQVLNDHFIY